MQQDSGLDVPPQASSDQATAAQAFPLEDSSQPGIAATVAVTEPQQHPTPHCGDAVAATAVIDAAVASSSTDMRAAASTTAVAGFTDSGHAQSGPGSVQQGQRHQSGRGRSLSR